MQAPFPWFGGKSRAADVIWLALGDVDNYVEPFAGSLGVLLGRPTHGGIETINDTDGLLANFWRSVATAPDAVAEAADWPVSEVDLTARHLRLVQRRAEVTERLQTDPDWRDPVLAGWWVWGICSWIGSGWCSGDGPWTAEDGRWVDLRQLPHLGDAGRGINRKLPHLGNAGQGINRQLPHLGDAGQGIRAWMGALADRLRRVRVCCGDWSRVVTPSVTYRHGLTGVVLDPPYPDGFSPNAAYSGQSGSAADLWRDVVAWATEAGTRRDMRIVLCGYDGAGDPPDGWREATWTPRKGYQGEDNDNTARERLWLSPACTDADRQIALFGGGA